MLLELLSFFGIAVGFIFLTLSIASGLYYLSELVEERSEPARKFLTLAIYCIMSLYVLLMLFDSFPIKLSIFSIACYVVYLQNLKNFPYISFTGPSFLLSCVLVVVNHYLWFQHFNDNEIPPQFRYDPNYIPKKRASFAEVTSFFGICVWFIPFALFVSLSAGDNILPTSNDRKKDDDRKSNGLAKTVIGAVRDYFYSCARVFGFEDPNYGRLGY